MKRIKITNKEVEKLSNASDFEFPKYTSQIINWANQNAQGTRAKVVGQMSDLIQEFDGQTLSEWVKWYNDKMPTAVDDATEKIYDMVNKIREAAPKIDKEMVRNWVKDLVYTKTYCGLRVQQAVISYIAQLLGKTWRLSNKEEESRGIDGYVGNLPVQVKSSTYRVESFLNETIDVPIIYYEKKKDGLIIEYNPSEIQ